MLCQIIAKLPKTTKLSLTTATRTALNIGALGDRGSAGEVRLVWACSLYPSRLRSGYLVRLSAGIKLLPVTKQHCTRQVLFCYATIFSNVLIFLFVVDDLYFGFAIIFANSDFNVLPFGTDQ